MGLLLNPPHTASDKFGPVTSEPVNLSPHRRVGGLTDGAEEAIAELAIEAFAAIGSIWREPWSAPPLPSGLSGPWTEITRRVLRCGASCAAVAAMDADPVVGPAIRSGQLYAGVGGSGGILQAELLPLDLVEGAAMELAARAQELTEHDLVRTAVANLRKLRSGIAGDTYDGWMLTAFRGVHLLPSVPISTPWGELVDAERMSSEMWAPDGCSAVLATPIRSWLRPKSWEPSRMFGSEAQQLSLDSQRIAQLVSYGLALGSNHRDPATAVPVGAGELLPTGMGGRAGALRLVSFHNRQSPISTDEATEAVQWMKRLDAVALDRIDLALRRLVRGLAERLDYLDSLIDAVIAWENLVESRAQPTKSVLWGIFTLTGSGTWSKSRIDKVYKARSDVVHGELPDYAHSKDFASDALCIGLDALRFLLDDHADKLDMTSEQRVAALGFVVSEGDTVAASPG